ncbi:MAG: glycosyltransferase family 2 protein [Halioglobus sp.]
MRLSLDQSKISIVIPVYRNEGSVRELYFRLVDAIQTLHKDLNYQIIFVDDGSDDNSLQELLAVQSQDLKVTVIKLSKNFGQFAANNAGFQIADGDIVVNMSADLQDPPELIVPMINRLMGEDDIVLAVRAKTEEKLFKKMTSWLHYSLVAISVPAFPKGGFDFWAVNRKAFNAFMSFNDVIRRNQIDLLSIGFKIGTVEYNKLARPHGTSQYNFFKRLDISISQILASAFWPLRLASTVGLLFTGTGAIYAIYLILSYLLSDTSFQGWTSIMMMLLIIGGMIMSTLGIMGEYLWRIYFETKQRPLYFIDRIYSGASEDNDET